MQKYIHYGTDVYVPEYVIPVRGNSSVRLGSKILGKGLWASPVESDAWKEWCLLNDFRTESLDKSFTFSLKKEAKILVIDKNQDFFDNARPSTIIRGLDDELVLDYKNIVKKYDAIHLTERGLIECASLYSIMGLSGWDCESLFVFRKESIVVDDDNEEE